MVDLGGFTLLSSVDPTPDPPGRDVIRLAPAINVGGYVPWWASSLDYLARIDRMGDLSGQTVVEVGTGSGLLAIACALRGATVHATEVNPQMHAYALASIIASGVTVDLQQRRDGEHFPATFDLLLANLADADWQRDQGNALVQRATHAIVTLPREGDAEDEVLQR